MNYQGKRWWFIFFQNNILVQKNKEGLVSIPFAPEVDIPKPKDSQIHEYTFHAKYACTAFELKEPLNQHSEYQLISLRESFYHLPLWMYQAAGVAQQLIFWDKNTRYCPACGTPTKRKTLIMKKCPHCGKEQYPPIQTAIIVLIQRGDEILLAHAHNFKSEFYGLIAGFVEVGETLEETVKREVKEETGLDIKNINYFGNQPWPYPSGLMVGFTAEYESGEICIQKEELRNAAFFNIKNLPTLPQKLSIARRMIDWWIDQQHKKE